MPRLTLDRYYSDLIEAAALADAQAADLEHPPGAAGEPAGADHGSAEQAHKMLVVIATRMRSAAAIFDQDPSLRDEPDGTGLDRGLALLPNLAHSAMRMIRQAQSSRSQADGHSASQWAEAAAITDRVDDLAERVLDTLPRPDYDTVDGARRISRARLAAQHDDLTAAADLIDSAVKAALRVAHPHDDAVGLAALADQVRHRAMSLAEHHNGTQETVARALGLQP